MNVVNSRKIVLLVVILFIAVLQFVLQAGHLTRGIDFVVYATTVDDTYYYLQTAYNTKLFGFPSFDGLHRTNGVQFLWFLVLIFVSILVPAKLSLLYAALFIACALNALGHLFIYKIGSILRRPILAVAMSVSWFYANTYIRWYLSGMENSLHAFIIWMLLWQVVVFIRRLGVNETVRLWPITILAVLNVWTRLDSALFSVLLYLYCVVRLFRSDARGVSVISYRKMIGSSILIALSGGIVLFVSYWLMGRTLLPVSGLVKMSSYDWEASTLATVAINGFEISSLIARQIFFGKNSFLQLDRPIWSSVFFLVYVLVVLQLLFSKYTERTKLIEYRSLWGFLLIASLLHLGYLAGFGSHVINYGFWYQSAYYIFCIVTSAVLIDGVLFLAVETRWPGCQFVPATVLMLLILVPSVSKSYDNLNRSVNRDHLYYRRWEVSRWMSEYLEADAIVGSYNAGAYGFFSNRTVINLDGLVNDAAYYSQIIGGDVSVVDYLADQQVDYVVDYYFPEELLDYLKAVQTFPVSKNADPIQVMRFTPE